MKVALRQIGLLALLIACVPSASCKRGDSSPERAADAKTAKPAAEESFDLIMETFRRRMEDTPIGFVVADGKGRSTLIGTNKVDSELIRPATPSDSYKAVVTVTSRSSYSIKRSKESSQEDGKSTDDSSGRPGGESNSDSSNALGGGQAPAQFSAGGEQGKSADDTLRRPDEEVRKYELLYKDGKWVLTTELNKETEQSIKNAFDSALAHQ